MKKNTNKTVTKKVSNKVSTTKLMKDLLKPSLTLKQRIITFIKEEKLEVFTIPQLKDKMLSNQQHTYKVFQELIKNGVIEFNGERNRGKEGIYNLVK